MSESVRDRHPPEAIGKVLNPVMRALLRSPAGRRIKGLAVLEFAGRRSGRRLRVVVGWHEVDGQPVVFTPAPWRVNFTGGWPATVRHRGSTAAMTGTLETDADAVAAALAAVLADGTSAQAVGLHIADGHEISADDVRALQRAMIRFA